MIKIKKINCPKLTIYDPNNVSIGTCNMSEFSDLLMQIAKENVSGYSFSFGYFIIPIDCNGHFSDPTGTFPDDVFHHHNTLYTINREKILEKRFSKKG